MLKVLKEKISSLSLAKKLLFAVALYLLAWFIKDVGFGIMMDSCTHGNCKHGAYSKTSIKWVWQLGGHLMTISFIFGLVIFFTHKEK